MAITNAVIDLGNTQSFQRKVDLCYWTVANQVCDGTFPGNIVTADDKNRVTAYALQIIRGQTDRAAQRDSILCTVAMQTAINSTPQGDLDTIMLAQAKQQLKLLVGIVTTYV
jgi:hypothetical protein